MKNRKLRSTLVHPSRVHPDPGNPRRTRDRAYYLELLGNVKNQGIITPLLVREMPGIDGYVIINGHGRWQCGIELGLEEIPVNVVEGDLTPLEVLAAQISDNTHREAVNPVEHGLSVRNYMQMGGFTAAQAAAGLSLNPSTVTKLLGCLDLSADLQEAVKRRQLSVEAGYQISRIPDEGLRAEFARHVMDGKWTRDDLARAVSEKVSPKKANGTAKRVSLKLPQGTLSFASAQPLTPERLIEVLEPLLKEVKKARNKGLSFKELEKLVSPVEEKKDDGG